MNYCFFSAQYLPTTGGVERYTFNLACQLVQKHHRVIIVTSALPNLPGYEVTAQGIVIYRFPCFSLLGGRMPVPKFNKQFSLLKRKLMQEDIDFAVLQTRLYLNSVLGAAWMKKKAVPTILLEHGTSHIQLGSPVFDALGQIYEHYTTWRIKQGCKHFYGVSNACNQWLLHFGINAKGVLYNCIDPDEIALAKQANNKSFRTELGIEHNIKLVSFAGRIVKEKGVFKLLQAAQLAQAQGLPLHIVVAGDGPMLHQAQSQKPPNVSLVGNLPHNDVLALMCESDIFCLPTDYAEGFPTGVLEAVACGAFVITTTRGGSKELITDHSLGIVLQHNTPQDILNALAKAINDDEYRTNAAAKCCHKMLQAHTWSKASETLISIATHMSNK